MPHFALRRLVGPVLVSGFILVCAPPDGAGQEETREQKIRNALSAAPTYIAQGAAMCSDEAFLRLRLAGLDPDDADVDRAGISYMLQGGPDVDDEGRQTLGSHVMLAIPGNHPPLERIGQGDRPDGPYVADLGDDLVMLILPVAGGDEALRVVPEP